MLIPIYHCPWQRCYLWCWGCYCFWYKLMIFTTTWGWPGATTGQTLKPSSCLSFLIWKAITSSEKMPKSYQCKTWHSETVIGKIIDGVDRDKNIPNLTLTNQRIRTAINYWDLMTIKRFYKTKESELSKGTTFWMGEKFCKLQTSQITNI